MLARLLNRCAVALALRSKWVWLVFRALGLLSVALVAGCAAPDLPIVNHWPEISGPFPVAPSGLLPLEPHTATAKGLQDGQPSFVVVEVGWNPSSNATGYRVYFTPDLRQPFTVIGETSTTNMIFLDCPFSSGFFRVTATNLAGESP